jgi:tRNA threonylcarbamoyladenosine biosynthesis protein TsaB
MAYERIIAVETSGRHGSVALALGDRLLEERAFPVQQEHARDLLAVVEALRADQGWPAGQIDQVHVSIGPGSFTGLRVAVAFARALALASRAKIVAVPTLEVIARNCLRLPVPPGRLAVILDAKRGQVYAAVFDLRGGACETIVAPHLAEPAAVLAGRPAVVGEGVGYHRPAVEASGAEVLDEALSRPKAACVHEIGWRLAKAGQFTPARELTPLYIRRPEAEEVWERRQAGG